MHSWANLLIFGVSCLAFGSAMPILATALKSPTPYPTANLIDFDEVDFMFFLAFILATVAGVIVALIGSFKAPGPQPWNGLSFMPGIAFLGTGLWFVDRSKRRLIHLPLWVLGIALALLGAFCLFIDAHRLW